MAETHGILIYERLLSFAEYRKENGSELQQAIYTDVLKYLSGTVPDNDRLALHSVARISHELTEMYVAAEHHLEAQGCREDFANELKEIYAIIALTKPKEFK